MDIMSEIKKKKTSRDKQAEETKQRIYETGIALFSDKGFDETSITEICRKADCSVGAFYHYFPSKDSILEETFRMADDDFNIWNTSCAQNFVGRVVVLEYMRTYAELVISSGLEFSKRFYTWKNKIFIKKGRPMQTRLIELIRDEVDLGNLKLTVSPEEGCEWLFVCARGVVFHWCLYEGDFDLKERMLETVDRALKGIEAV